MYHSSRAITPALVFLFIMCVSGVVGAQPQQAGPSREYLHYASKIAKTCPQNWSANACLSSVSESTLVLTANYAQALQNEKQIPSVETLKQDCAAATAATRGQYPAYAMKSAFTECANTMSTLAENTGIVPDVSHYQLLLGAIWCLGNDRRCVWVEQGLKKY
jgi:hypothetical protein